MPWSSSSSAMVSSARSTSVGAIAPLWSPSHSNPMDRAATPMTLAAIAIRLIAPSR